MINREYYSLQQVAENTGLSVNDLIHLAANGRLPVYANVPHWHVEAYRRIRAAVDGEPEQWEWENEGGYSGLAELYESSFIAFENGEPYSLIDRFKLPPDSNGRKRFARLPKSTKVKFSQLVIKSTDLSDIPDDNFDSVLTGIAQLAKAKLPDKRPIMEKRVDAFRAWGDGDLVDLNESSREQIWASLHQHNPGLFPLRSASSQKKFFDTLSSKGLLRLKCGPKNQGK